MTRRLWTFIAILVGCLVVDAAVFYGLYLFTQHGLPVITKWVSQ